jgi:starch synthase
MPRKSDARGAWVSTGLLRQRASVLTGILNGIDETVWNPATIPTLPARVRREAPATPRGEQGGLQSRFGLHDDPASFVLRRA